MSASVVSLAFGLEAEPAQAPPARTEAGFDGMLALAASEYLSLGTEPTALKPVKRGKKGESPAPGAREPAEVSGFALVPSAGASGPPSLPAGAEEATRVLLDAALGFHQPEAPPESSAGDGADEEPESFPELSLDDEPRDLSDGDALAVQLDRMGIDVEVRGLAVPQEPHRFSDAPVSSATSPLDVDGPAPEIIDHAAAMDLRALEVRDGVTVRVNDAGQAWEIDVVRHDNTLDLAIRADAPVREIIAAEQQSIRAAVAREGYQLGSLDIAERSVETAQAVKATAASQSLDNTSSQMSHENPNPQARREELPPWPAPRPGRHLRATAAEPTRQGRLDRDA